MTDDWERATGAGHFDREVADYLSDYIDDPYSITHMDASWDGAAWTIYIEHDGEQATEFTIDDRELPDWWWEDLYEWADEIGAEWELAYEEGAA